MSHNVITYPHLIKFVPKVPSLTPLFNVYGFDLDHTLIQPKSGGKFSRDADDWKFMTFSNIVTIDKLIEITNSDDDAQIVVFTNQGGVVSVPPTSKSCVKFTDKIKNILNAIKKLENGEKLLAKLWIYASPKKPASLFPKATKSNGKVVKKSVKKELLNVSAELFESIRKPEIGMSTEFVNDLTKIQEKNSIKWIFYCGDAAGRKADFSDSDKVFAKNLNVAFKLPEEIFKVKLNE